MAWLAGMASEVCCASLAAVHLRQGYSPWFGQTVRSCDLAPMDVGPGLETSFLVFILLCTFLPYLCRKAIDALES